MWSKVLNHNFSSVLTKRQQNSPSHSPFNCQSDHTRTLCRPRLSAILTINVTRRYPVISPPGRLATEQSHHRKSSRHQVKLSRYRPLTTTNQPLNVFDTICQKVARRLRVVASWWWRDDLTWWWGGWWRGDLRWRDGWWRVFLVAKWTDKAIFADYILHLEIYPMKKEQVEFCYRATCEKETAQNFLQTMHSKAAALTDLCLAGWHTDKQTSVNLTFLIMWYSKDVQCSTNFSLIYYSNEMAQLISIGLIYNYAL